MSGDPTYTYLYPDRVLIGGMVDILNILLPIMAGVIAYFVGSMLSPHAKAYKVQAQTWQGQYSGLKKQLIEIQGNLDDQDPINQLLKSLGLDPKLSKTLKPLVQPIIENYLKTGKLVIPGIGQVGGDKSDPREGWQ